MDRRDLPRESEPRVASRQDLQTSTQDEPWKGVAGQPPALTGVATGDDGLNAEAGWLTSVSSELRSFLGIAALMVFLLPAVVLGLTLLGSDAKPVPIKTATARDGGSETTRRAEPERGERSGNGEVSDRLPGSHEESPGTSSGDDVTGSTGQTGRDQSDANQAQDTTGSVSTTPKAAAAGSPEPASTVSPSASSSASSSVAASPAPATVPADSSVEAPTASTPSVPPDTSTGPTTATRPTSDGSAPPTSQQDSSVDPSASAIARGMPAPSDVPAKDVQEGDSNVSRDDASEYAGGSP